jgi:hypothetical protein
MQFRRLDPLANASPYQRIAKAPVKSFTLTEEQFDRIKERRPELIAMDGDGAVVSHPYRDYLEVHYGFSEVVFFRDNFGELFNRSVGASTKAEAPRGVVIAFRDRPNRALANPTFWPLALEEGREWVEMSWVAVPEMEEPSPNFEGGFTIRQATDADRETISKLDGEANGQPALSEGGLNSLFENSRAIHLVHNSSGIPVGFLSPRSEPGGWGILDLTILASLKDQLVEPLLRWSVAWLRNNGGRRMRAHVYLENAAELAALRNLGFTAGETGIDYVRPVDAGEIQAKIEERQAHGTMIKFGWWR